MQEIGEVHYHKCENCGFVLSKTHAELEKEIWTQLNSQVHNHPIVTNQPPYLEQAMMLKILSTNNLICTNSMVDYASGAGILSNVLKKYFKIDLPIFDPYIKKGNKKRYLDVGNLKSYKTVINSAFFEHVLRRDDLEAVNNLVDKDGCMVLHTVVCENIPDNPDWFYLEPPVHSAFHTNKSMEILMKQWGYASSVYNPGSKCWVLFKHDNFRSEIQNINQEFKTDVFHYSSGFVNYWKGF
ncbi:methyltransferase domain-containing protein [Maribellus comscasis]|nr:methyltransferase domain-containing protein [Maribellus comscasis]